MNNYQTEQKMLPPSSSNLVTVQSGYTINPDDRIWLLDKDVTVNLGFIDKVNSITADFIRGTLLERAKKYMPATIRNECFAIKDLLRNVNTLNSSEFFSWLPTAKSSAYPVIIKSFVIYGYNLGIDGVSVDFIKALKEHVLSANRGVTIKPVETHDLFEGPFSDLELQNIMARSLVCYTEGKIPLHHYAALMLFAQTGRRGIQASNLKIKDLLESTTKDDIPVYYINVPRRKQRGQTFRETFNKTIIDQDLWIVLQLQAAQVKQIALDNIKDFDDDRVLDELPLFPSKNLNNIDDMGELTRKTNGDFLHIKSAYLSKLVASSSEILNIVSERTGKLLHITPNRFRHTIGTNAAREGYGARVIAEILDHTTDVVAGTYTKNTPDIVERLDRALAMQLAPLAQTFVGVIIKGENDATRKDDPSSRISNGNSNLGSCGRFGFCSASAPIACYTCQQFQPWLNAPHEDVLTHLLRERERIMQVTGDKRIASVNDRLILAVTEVIQRCEEQNITLRDTDNG